MTENKSKNIELGELTEFGNVAIPNNEQKLVVTFMAGNGEIIQLQTDQNGRPNWVKGID